MINKHLLAVLSPFLACSGALFSADVLPMRIDFGPASHLPATGYVRDGGAVFGLQGHGLVCGWALANGQTTAGGIEGNAADASWGTGLELTSANPWELSLPNGWYRVQAVTGVRWYSWHWWKQVKAEGVTLIDSFPCPGGPYWLQGDAEVEVTDGRLTLTGDAPWNYLSNVVVTPVTVRAPVLTGATSFAASTSVTLVSPTSGAKVRYTLDGSTPTATSRVANGTFTISKNALLRAVAFDASGRASAETKTNFWKGTGTGWQGQFFAGLQPTGPVLAEQTAPVLDFSWNQQAPQPGVPADYFCVRWAGTFKAPFDGTYTIRAFTDDGVRMWAQDRQILNNYRDQEPIATSTTVTMKAGESTQMVLDYFNAKYASRLLLVIEHPLIPRQVMPTALMTPGLVDGPLAVTCPVSSLTSPVSLTVDSLAGVTPTVRVVGKEVSVTPLSDDVSWAEAPLAAANKVTVVTKVPGRTKKVSIRWQPLPVTTAASVTMRATDSLLLDIPANTAVLVSVGCGVGVEIAAASEARQQAWTPGESGAYVLTSQDAHGGTIAQVAVTAVSASLPAGRACGLGFRRDLWATASAPATSIGQVVIETGSKPWVSTADSFVADLDAGRLAYKYVPYQRGLRTVVARLGNAGPVIDAQEMIEFGMRSTAEVKIPVVDMYSDGSAMGRATLTMSPLVRGCQVQCHVIKAGVTFGDGSLDMAISTSEFTEINASEMGAEGRQNGAWDYYLILSAQATTGACHNIITIQDGVKINE